MGETGRSHSGLHLAAICHDGGGHIDRLMAEVAAGLRAQGCRLCGVIQSNPAPAPGQRCDMLLEELSSGEKFPISQRLGLESQACRLDSAALEEVVHLVERSLGDAPDMLLLNKFGRQESEGKGLRLSIARALELGVPVLVGLNRSYLPAWTRFAGAEGALLEAELDPVLRWCAKALRLAPESPAVNP